MIGQKAVKTLDVGGCTLSSLSSSVRSRESQLRPIESGARELLVAGRRQSSYATLSILFG